MARVPQVTRTIQTTRCKVLCINTDAEEVFTQEVTIPRTYQNEKNMLKKIKPLLETESVKVVHVQEYVVESTLYGMTEEEFIRLAQVLPSRNGNT